MDKIILILSVLFTLSTESALAQVNCSSATACSVQNIPLIDQNNPALLSQWGVTSNGSTTTMLCAPTAVAMALSSLTDGNLSVLPGTVSANFKAMNYLDRVNYIAQLIGTTRTGGSFWDNMGNTYAGRAVDFTATLSGRYAYASTTVAADSKRILTDMSQGMAPTVQYGHYNISCTNLLSGELSCTYQRNGGHAMAVKAVSGTSVTFNDPWYANVFSALVSLAPSMTSQGQTILHILPSQFSQSTAYQFKWSTTYAAMMEGIVSVGGSANLASSSPAPQPLPTPQPLPQPSPPPLPPTGSDTTPPSTAITSPANSMWVPVSTYIELNASARDNVGVSKVEFYVNGNLRCTTSIAPYRCSTMTTYRRGRVLRIQSKAYDAAGNVGTSAIVSVTTY